MSPPADPEPEVPRRTWLAAERTWLAWWRTGLGAAALAIAVGRVLPGLSGGARWPFRVLGLGYGALAAAVLVAGAVRQRRTVEALRRAEFDELGSRLVMSFTASAVVLSLLGIVLILVAF